MKFAMFWNNPVEQPCPVRILFVNIAGGCQPGDAARPGYGEADACDSPCSHRNAGTENRPVANPRPSFITTGLFFKMNKQPAP